MKGFKSKYLTPSERENLLVESVWESIVRVVLFLVLLVSVHQLVPRCIQNHLRAVVEENPNLQLKRAM